MRHESLPHGGQRRSIRPISEKAAELLFAGYLLQAFGLGQARLFAPSSWEEHRWGYDQAIAGEARQLYLQFKSPEYTAPDRFKIRLSAEQHHTLKGWYSEPGEAYYVAHLFPSRAAAGTAQGSPPLEKPWQFLSHFVCMDAWSLPCQATVIDYATPDP